MYNVLSAVLSAFVCGGGCLDFSFHLVEIYFDIFSFHFSYPPLEISQVIVVPVEIHQAFAAVQDVIWRVPGANRKTLSLL